MRVVANHPHAVRRYLEEFEYQLKRQPGASPEEALSDAREFLTQAAAGLTRSGEGPDDEGLYLELVDRFGPPAEVAGEYAAGVRPVWRLPGHAPGWRICCTRCGRSAPLSRVGGVRVGARSFHKYTVGFCRDCRRLRFLRIIRDLDKANLTARLGESATPQEVRRAMHRPVLVVLAILTALAVIHFLAHVAFADELEQVAAENRQVAERLRSAVLQSYSYRDRLKIDWEKRYGEYEPRLLAAADVEAFARVAAEFLRAAQDLHIWLKLGERLIPTYRRDLKPNFNPRVLPRLILNLKQHGKTVLVGSFPDGVRYVAIGTWDAREPESMEAAVAAVGDAARAGDPLILDVRPNSGGDEKLARRIAAFFVEEPAVYAKHVLRIDGEDSPPQQRVHPGRRWGPAPGAVRRPDGAGEHQ